MLVDLVLDDGIRESLDLIAVGIDWLVCVLGVSLSRASIPHEVLINLVHESLVILPVGPIEGAVNLELPLFGILFYGSHQVGCAFWSACLCDIDDVVHESGHDRLVEILIYLSTMGALHNHRHTWKVIRALTLKFRNILSYGSLNGELPLPNVRLELFLQGLTDDISILLRLQLDLELLDVILGDSIIGRICESVVLLQLLNQLLMRECLSFLCLIQALLVG